MKKVFWLSVPIFILEGNDDEYFFFYFLLEFQKTYCSSQIDFASVALRVNDGAFCRGSTCTNRKRFL